MSFELPFQRLVEYKRLKVDVELTEEGLFAVDELPEDYAGSFIARIELVYAVLHVDNSGRLRLSTYNPPDVQNKGRQADLPIEILGEHEVRSGANSPTLTVEWRDNSHLSTELSSRAGLMWASMKRQIGEWGL